MSKNFAPPNHVNQTLDPFSGRGTWAEKCRYIQTENAQALRRHGYRELADKLLRCIVKGEEADNLDQIRFAAAPLRCHSRYCQFCSNRLGRKAARKNLLKLKQQIENGYKTTGITLTVPNTPDIEWLHFEHLFDCFKKFIHSTTLQQNIIGGVVKADLTYNTNHLDYHLHLHAVLVHRKRLPSKENLGSAWFEASSGGLNWTTPHDVPDYLGRIINISSITSHKHSRFKTAEKIQESVKYLCKPILLPQSHAFVKYFETTYKRPLTRSYGVMHGNSSVTILDIGGNELIKGKHESGNQVEQIIKKRQTRPTDRPINQLQIPRLHKTHRPEQTNANLLTEDLSHLKYEERERQEAQIKGLLEGNNQLLWAKFNNKIITDKEAHAQHTMKMRGGVNCPNCFDIMPPQQNLCERCEADAAKVAELFARTQQRK